MMKQQKMEIITTLVELCMASSAHMSVIIHINFNKFVLLLWYLKIINLISLEIISDKNKKQNKFKTYSQQATTKKGWFKWEIIYFKETGKIINNNSKVIVAMLP